MCKTISVKEQAWEFFVYTTLGIVPEKLFDKDVYFDYINGLLNKECIEYEEFSYELYSAFMCAKAAYGDLNRTLEYKEKYKDGNEDKEKTINMICVEIAKKILKNGLNDINPEKCFGDLLNSIDTFKFLDYLALKRKKTGEKQEFTFGQAQKWVNMTLKYLYLLDLIDSDKNLHIPVDSYIIDAAWEIEELDLPLKNKKTDRTKQYKKPSDYVVAWSRWTNKSIEENGEGEYDLLQKGICKVVNTSNDYHSVLDWEHENWIRISEKRKGIKITGK